MMSRLTFAVDRVVTFVVALLLLALGAGALWTWSGRGPVTGTLRTGSATDLIGQSWWPWASAVVGVLLVLLGLRWIAAHLNRQNVGRLHLRGSGSGGRLDVTASKVAGAAADAFSDTLGVRSARGVVVRDRGQMVARLTATIEPEADLALLARQADLVSAQLAQVLERDDLRCSVQLKVASLSRSLPRVR